MYITQRSATRGGMKGVVGRLRLWGFWSLFGLALACSSADAKHRDTASVDLIPLVRPQSDSIALRDSLARSRADSANRLRVGYVVDSARSPEQQLARFRSDLTPVSQLAYGARSREELVGQLQRAIASNDVSAMDRLLVTRAEFGWLVYPESPYTHPPFLQDPEIVWGLIQFGSHAGRDRLLARRHSLSILPGSLKCEAVPERQGKNALWAKCVVRSTDNAARYRRFFGTILERDGHYKFLSLANEF